MGEREREREREGFRTEMRRVWPSHIHGKGFTH